MSDRFQVDLRGIIDLAANHLYESPDVFIRELLQNGVDAITARRLIDPAFVGTITLELTSDERTLCVRDNGIGLTRREVDEFLSTVGGSSKRQDAETLAEHVAETGTFLGRFGIGLLSCFMVSDEILVLTRSARDASAPAIEWRGRADGGYCVTERPESRISPGTSVYLKPKDGFAEYFEREQLIDLARQYGQMLRTRIVVSGAGDVVINRAKPPWDLDESDTETLHDYCQEALGFRPLDAFRIEATAGDVVGYGFIRSDRTPSCGGRHLLYAHGMFVSDSVYGLVPHWAGFVGCVLNTRGLRLTASRESLHHNETLEQAQEQIGAAIRGRLGRLLRFERDKFDAIMSVHDTEIRGLAVKDPEFFNIIIDLLEFDTTLGRIRFGDFWREHERLLLARTNEQFRRLAPIAAEAGLRVFNGGYTYHEELLAKACERHPEIELRTFDTADLAETLTPPDDAERFEGLRAAAESALEEKQCQVVVREFEPSALPAFYALGLDAEFHRDLDQIKSRASGLWEEILDILAPRPETLVPTRLCLNARCPLVRRLAGLRDPDLQRTAIEVLYVQSLMAGQHPLTGEEMELLSQGMELLLMRCTGESGVERLE